jgi:hypothetical protein
MNTKISILSAAVLMGISSMAVSTSVSAASANPPAVPGATDPLSVDVYANGPQSPLVANTDLSASERQAYALYEAVLQITEAKIHATSCQSAADSIGTASVSTYTDGIGFQADTVTVISPASSLTLQANSLNPVPFRGQQIQVVQNGIGSLGQSTVLGYFSDFYYNNVNNMLVSNNARVSVLGINGVLDSYQGTVIKDFYRGSLDSNSKDYYTIFDYGLQSLSKLGFPVNKYWQRSKSRRDNGGIGRTVFVKDRLVGASACRITIDTMNYNNQSYFWQSGTLKVESVTPATPVSAFQEVPFI